MNYVKRQQKRVQRRIRRVRGKIFGTKEQPRVSITRSNQHVYLQAIDDEQGVTMVSSSDYKHEKGTKTERAILAAKDLAAALKKAKVKAVAFDRGPYNYHGRVAAVAQTLREEGIKV